MLKRFNNQEAFVLYRDGALRSMAPKAFAAYTEGKARAGNLWLAGSTLPIGAEFVEHIAVEQAYQEVRFRNNFV